MINSREFRNAVGQFATGVTIVTTTDADGNPVGVTANSFSSVSLDPPLVLWSLAKSAHSIQAYQTFGYFGIHVLSVDQKPMSDTFARSGEDKFSGVDFQTLECGIPAFDGCAARLVCKTNYQYDGGDHIIFVGEVLDCIQNNKPPLLFHSGKYREARSHIPNGSKESAIDLEEGTFSQEFLFYQVARAHYQISSLLDAAASKVGLTRLQHFTLIALSMTAGLTLEQTQNRLQHTGVIPDQAALDVMVSKGWLKTSGGDSTLYQMTAEGKRLFISILARTKAIEESTFEHYSAQELGELRGFLQRLIGITGSEPYELWAEAFSR